jgi:hypothetical protein
MSAPRNLKISRSEHGVLITADSRKPAPEFAELLKSLATPDPYQGRTCPKYRAAIDRWMTAWEPKK